MVCSSRFQNALDQAESSSPSEDNVQNGAKSQSFKKKGKGNKGSRSNNNNLSAAESQQAEIAAAVLARLTHQPPLLEDAAGFLV